MGRYGDGRPFYAMRFIRGKSFREAIDEFHNTDWNAKPVGAKTVALRRLLDRLLDVCNAIFYAHRRGVLHRDIKPSNIMLGDYGETLVVDWGLAKSMGKRDVAPTDSSLPSEATLLPRASSDVAATVVGRAIGSPPYMSPEQARGELDNLGVETDIYSLGATLYTVLTNARPVEGSDHTDTLRKVRSGEWPPPSQVQADVPRPLEAICLKAMSLEPRKRYRSVRALARDIEQFLANEPVSAYRERLSDRLVRLSRRHRTMVRAGILSLVAISLISIAAAVSINQQKTAVQQQRDANRQLALKESASRREAEQRQAEAIASKARAEAVQEYLVDIFRSPDPEKDGSKITVEELLRNAVAEIPERFAGDQIAQGDLLHAIGSTLFGTGLYRLAVPTIESAWQVRKESLGESNEDTIESLSLLASTDLYAGRPDDALRMSQQAYALSRKVYGDGDELTLKNMTTLATSYELTDDAAKAVSLYEKALELCREHLGDTHRQTLATAASLANAYVFEGEVEKAIDLGAPTLEKMRQTLGDDHQLCLSTMNILAGAYNTLGRHDEAIKMHQQSLAVSRQTMGDEHPKTWVYMRSLALSYISAGRLDEAKQQIQELYDSIDVQRERLGEDHPFPMSTERLQTASSFGLLGAMQLTGDYWTKFNSVTAEVPDMRTKFGGFLLGKLAEPFSGRKQDRLKTAKDVRRSSERE